MSDDNILNIPTEKEELTTEPKREKVRVIPIQYIDKTEIGFDTFEREFFINFKGKLTHRVPLGRDANGIITRLDNVIDSLSNRRNNSIDNLQNLKEQVQNAREEIAAPFPGEAELEAKSKRLDELNTELNMDRRENELADEDREQSDDVIESKEEKSKGDFDR